MTDFERYTEILRIMSDTSIDSVSKRAGYLALKLAGRVPSSALMRACENLLLAYSEVAMLIPHASPDQIERMYDKSRRQLASSLMHLVSPTWE